MKIVKMGLATAALVGASAFAIDNVKVSGNVQLFYSTQDAKVGYTAISRAGASLFDKDSSAADAGLNLNISADLVKTSLVTVSAGAGYTALSTLGLENNFVGNVWGGAHGATAGTGASYASALGGAQVDTASWMNEAWVALSLNKGSKSTLKLGRMELDTPLAFTEKWSIEKNTFEAGVLINQDIPDTTLVAAYVGNGNGNETFGMDERSIVNKNNLSMGAIVNKNGNFETYGKDGAYAYGIINNSWKPLSAQAWLYDVSKVAHAYWLQADLDTTTIGVNGFTAGIQYVYIDASDFSSDNGGSSTASKTIAYKLGYAVKDIFAASIAYSSVSDDGIVGAANTATSTGASKLYTEAWWNYGQVSAIGASSWNITVTSPVAGLFDAGLYFTTSDQKGVGQDLTEFAITAGKKFGPLDVTIAYIGTAYNHESQAKAKVGESYLHDSNMLQAYLTLNF